MLSICNLPLQIIDQIFSFLFRNGTDIIDWLYSLFSNFKVSLKALKFKVFLIKFWRSFTCKFYHSCIFEYTSRWKPPVRCSFNWSFNWIHWCFFAGNTSLILKLRAINQLILERLQCHIAVNWNYAGPKYWVFD